MSMAIQENLAEWRARKREEVAREGYGLYADEAREFAGLRKLSSRRGEDQRSANGRPG